MVCEASEAAEKFPYIGQVNIKFFDGLKRGMT